MGRYPGKTVINYTYNVNDYRPLDTRMLVPTYADLTLESNWLVKGESNTYNGMIVAVGSNTADLTKNGVYYLFDAKNPGADDLPDVTKEENWHKLCNLADVNNIIAQLSSIGGEIASLDSRLDAVEASMGEGGNSTPSTSTVSKFSDLPEIGEENIVYIVEEENATYRWEADTSKYLCIGRETPVIQIICGGNASA
jgi:hypothetical protein